MEPDELQAAVDAAAEARRRANAWMPEEDDVELARAKARAMTAAADLCDALGEAEARRLALTD